MLITFSATLESVLSNHTRLAFIILRVRQQNDLLVIPGEPNSSKPTPSKLMHNAVSTALEYIPKRYWEIAHCMVAIWVFNINATFIQLGKLRLR